MREWFFLEKKIMLISYVSQNIIFKIYVHNFATFWENMVINFAQKVIRKSSEYKFETFKNKKSCENIFSPKSWWADGIAD